MTRFVLVHGAWLGGWCWTRVAAILKEAGHPVETVTLNDGVPAGDPLNDAGRGHSAVPGRQDGAGFPPPQTLEARIAALTALIETAPESQVVLAGHGLAGFLITAAACRVPGRIARLFYIDALVPRSGESWCSHHLPETAASHIEHGQAENVVAPPDFGSFGLSAPDCTWMTLRQRAEPFRLYQTPVYFEAAKLEGIPRSFIDCARPALDCLAHSRRRVYADTSWQIGVLNTGHYPMISEPRRLAQVLLQHFFGPDHRIDTAVAQSAATACSDSLS